ncbi:DNA-3-methyladenine glycosylase family protein [Geodermatophilus sp. URMC 62]|uniref:DNA-3-methyladenine glycosylase family protein n=1 Tax=Geodermatophilus sp. URMC 62 TaxID=3423414 RepID=UPI00406C1535
MLRLACWVEGADAAAGIAVTQGEGGAVTVRADAEPPRLTDQVARILGLDVDGAGFADVTAGDPVLAPLAAARPGFRPVSFESPYEAACWAVLSQRTGTAAAAGVEARTAERFGTVHDVDGVPVAAFPTPSRLAVVAADLPVPPVEQERLRGLAEAALDGRLDGGRLRALPAEQALASVRELPGIGRSPPSWSCCGAPARPTSSRPRSPGCTPEMAHRYGLADPAPAELAEVAERWRPYRSWAAVLLRAAAEGRALSSADGRRSRSSRAHPRSG